MKRPLFWVVQGTDFGRAIARAKARGNPLSVQIRQRLEALRSK